MQLVKEFPEFYGTRWFITALTSVRHLSLSWASPIQFTYTHTTYRRFILTLSAIQRLGLPSGLFPSSFPTKTLYAPLSSPIRATIPAHLILLKIYLIILTLLIIIQQFYKYYKQRQINKYSVARKYCSRFPLILSQKITNFITAK